MTEHFDLTPQCLRHVLGHFASGLTVITAATDNGPAGFTCQSFSSLSLDPALVTFSPARSSSTWPLLRKAGSFTVNVLPAGHRHLAGQFARSGTDKFAGVEFSASPLGNPALDQALAWVDCELHQEYDGGDHTIVVGAVRALGARDGAEPLLFSRAGISTVCLRGRAAGPRRMTRIKSGSRRLRRRTVQEEAALPGVDLRDPAGHQTPDGSILTIDVNNSGGHC